MARVVLEGDQPGGLAKMIAGLVEANIETDPGRERLLESARGALQLDVSDADVTIGLKFVPGCLTVTGSPVPGADVRLTADAATLLSFCTVPVRFGLPDVRTEKGRSVSAELFAGRLRVRGLPSGLPMMARVTRLLRVVE